jgi:hypothetical protein
MDERAGRYRQRVLARRVLILMAILLVLISVAAALAPQPRQAPPQGRSAVPAGEQRTERISAAEGAAPARVPVRRGDVLTLEVAGDVIDTVQLERLNRIDPIEPTTPARFTMLIEAPAGVYPIRLLAADRRIGMIEVTGTD